MRQLRAPAVILATLVSLPATARARDHRYLPTVSLAAAIEGEAAYFHSWLGVAMHRRSRGTLGGFASVGVELDVRGLEAAGVDYTVLDVRPAARAGLALYGDKINLPFLAVYGLAAYHPVSDLRGQALRLGLGLSVPALLPFFLQEAVPTMVETTWDVSDRDSLFALRIGWNI